MENMLVEGTFIGLMTIGFVNVFMFFFPTSDPRIKFGLSFLFAFALSFIPPDFSNMLLEHIKIGLGVAFAASGGYKLAQVIKKN